MALRAQQISQGATLAADGIPLHFGDPLAEYQAALSDAILLDRSHEARLELSGESAIDLLHRISTNDLRGLHVNEGRPTIFTNANARILDRVAVYRRENSLFALGEPGRGAALRTYLQRNIFFGDDVQLNDLSARTCQLELHGPAAAEVIAKVVPDSATLDVMTGCEAEIGGHAVYLARRRPVCQQRWTVVVSIEGAGALWTLFSDQGARPAGSLIYNVLRVRAGFPSVGRELSEQFIPLEIGLWDEVSFTKGCYTGQEIIARMESRNRLAKTLVRLQLEQQVDPPAQIFHEGRGVGQLTSCVTAPDGVIFALGVIKPALAEPGQVFDIGGTHATVIALAGAQPLHER